MSFFPHLPALWSSVGLLTFDIRLLCISCSSHQSQTSYAFRLFFPSQFSSNSSKTATHLLCSGRRLRCSSTCRALIVGLLATERSLLPVRRSGGTVCHTTLLTVCHRHNSAGNWKLFCFLYHFHDYIFFLVVLEFLLRPLYKFLMCVLYRYTCM